MPAILLSPPRPERTTLRRLRHDPFGFLLRIGLGLAALVNVSVADEAIAPALGEVLELKIAGQLSPVTQAIPMDTMQTGLRIKAKSLNYAMSLIGSPYKRGGQDPKKGTDCSGFVRHVYTQTTGIELPHNALQMSRQGEPVDKTELRPGDLVFFNTLRKPFSHVGIYVGAGEFVHASSDRHKRVMVSQLEERYWRAHFNGARRIPGITP